MTLFFIFPNSCKQKNISTEDICFYFWKTSYQLSTFEKEYLKKQNVKKIFLHCFDIIAENKLPKPQGVLLWKEPPLKNIEYIPTVFIRNEIFLDKDTSHLKDLLEKTFTLCTQIFSSQNLLFHEIQIDCDWTKTTRDSYFYFLALLKQKKLRVSNTLRLYQYKYRAESGIAPTDYATLMCYNMGNLKNENTENSILNKKDLEAYLGAQSAYPKPMNIALPIFNWTLLYSQHLFKGILYQSPELDHAYWEPMSDIQYLCRQNYYDQNCGQEFYKDEVIRIEQVSKEELNDAILTVNKHIKNTKNEITYFDLDSTKIRNCLY